jgi:hypothetical protein
MAFTPSSGDVAKMSIGTIDQPGINWKLDIDGNAKDASNFRDGRNIKTTLPNATATTTLIWDSAQQPTGTSGGSVKIGTVAACKFFVDDTKFFAGSFMVTKIGPENKGIEDIVTMDVTLMLNNGFITYPT